MRRVPMRMRGSDVAGGAGFGLLAVVGLGGCGLTTLYEVQSSVVAQAHVATTREGADPEQLALLATPRAGVADPALPYLRASAVPLPLAELRPGAPVRVRVPNARNYRIGGALLLGLGGSCTAMWTYVTVADMSSRWSDNRGWASMIAALVGGPLCVSTLITGGVYLRRGLRPAAQLPPGLPDVRYLDPQPPTAERGEPPAGAR